MEILTPLLLILITVLSDDSFLRMMQRKRPMARKDGSTNKVFVKRKKPGMQIIWKRNKDGEKVIHNHEFGLLFHYCTIGGGSRKPFWCSLRNFKGSATSVILRINCNENIFVSFSEGH